MTLLEFYDNKYNFNVFCFRALKKNKKYYERSSSKWVLCEGCRVFIWSIDKAVVSLESWKAIPKFRTSIHI